MSYLEVGEYQLPPDLTGELARIHRLVSEEYLWWKVQTAPRDALPQALAKLHAKYFILLDARARKARRDAGLPVAQVVTGYAPNKGGPWPLMLLATKKLKGEEMHHAAKKPPRWSIGEVVFQLVKDPRGKWRWELAPEVYTFYLETVILHISRREWDEIARFFHSKLDWLPNLKGINDQKLALLKRVEKAWGDLYLRTDGPRRRKPSWMKELKEKWKNPLSIRRVKTLGPPLEGVMAKLATG